MFSSSLTEKVRFQVITSPLQEAMDTGEQLRVVVEGVTLGGLRLELSTRTHWLLVFGDTSLLDLELFCLYHSGLL